MTRDAAQVHGFGGVARGLGRGLTRLRRLLAGAALGLALGAGPLLAQGAATLMADQVYVDGAGRLVASGAVEVWHGSVRLTAARVVFDRRRETLIIDGPISVSDGPDTLILADSAQLSPGLREGLITGARVVLDRQLQIAAASLRREGQVSQMTAVVASSCPVCAADPTPLWEIRADSVTHDEGTDQLHFRRAQFRLGGVPVFYLPNLRLPGPDLDRARGVLRPEVSLSSDLGLAVGLPYFIPLGEGADLTVTPVLSTEGMASVALRWRRAWRNGGIEIGGQVSHDDLTADDLRGYGYVQALFHLRNDWRLRAELLAASDRTYLETYDITDDSRLSAHVTLERIRRTEAARLRVLGFHSLRLADDNDTLPNAVVQGELDRRIALDHTPLGGTARVQLAAEGFRRVSALPGDAGRDVARAQLHLGWRRTGVLPGGVMTTVALDGRVDHVRISDDPAFVEPVTRSAAQAMVEFRWPWAMVGAGGVRHVVEPVVQLIEGRSTGEVLPNDDHTMPELDEGNLFALTRHAGFDAPDDGSRLNAGLRWTRHDASGWSTEVLAGRIWRRAALAGFDPAHVQPLGDTASHWLLAGRVARDQGLSFDLRLLVDPANDLSRAETNLAWTGPRTELATRYLYLPASAFENRDTTLSEWSFDVTQRFDSGWAGVVGWDYDVEQAQVATARAGVEFRNECLAFDLSMTRHFVTATNPTASTRYHLRFELLGIGGRAPSTLGRTCRA